MVAGRGYDYGTMPERYLQAIVKYLADRDYQPLKIRQLARRMGVEEAQYPAFRDAVKHLRDDGRVVLGPKSALTLPAMTNKVVGTFRQNPRGFGFVIPDEPNAHGDLYIPEGEARDAITGDKVVATVFQRGKREGRTIYHGRIVEVLARGRNRFVGELQKTEDFWVVWPQGSAITDPVIVDDVGPAGKSGQKVVFEIVRYAQGRDLAHGVIVEMLGLAGPADVETLGVIREHGLPDVFPDEALEQARSAVQAFTPQADPGREDLTGLTIATIDPDDARDYDDAISLEVSGSHFTLGVHIADVAHFVVEGTPLDAEARERGNSVYFPRKVIPMLPEVLSNGVCSLQEGQVRFVKSVFIEYDSDAHVVGTRFANARIRSRKRLTYTSAQGILDGRIGGYEPEVVQLLRGMDDLARRIEERRRQEGMLHLDLPEIELVLSEDGKVLDAEQADQSYTHTIIEMFMVEANEAVARLLDARNVPFLRRIHPESDVEGNRHLQDFIRACGYKLPKKMTRHDMQALVEAVRGRPESYAVNLALLKMFESAEYSPMHVGHFALASKHYCHFTSPIRRYPDLTVHRLLDAHLRGRLEGAGAAEDLSAVTQLGEHCGFTERRAERAENDLRSILILQLFQERIGETLEGVVTGITNFGVFVQSTKYLIEGLVKLEQLGDDWWDPQPARGIVTGQRSGRQIRMGDRVTAKIVAVDIPRRQLELTLEALPTAKRRRSNGEPGGGRRGPKRKGKPAQAAADGAAGAPGGQSTRGRRKPGRRGRR